MSAVEAKPMTRCYLAMTRRVCLEIPDVIVNL